MKRKPPTAAREKALFAVLAEDPGLGTAKARRAREELTRRNLGLVWKTANAFWLRPGSAVDRDDLFQAGVVGLLRAIEGFDPSRGFRFSTYAGWWIRQAVGRHLDDTATTVRVPANVRQDAEKVRRAGEALGAEGHGFDAENLRREAGLSASRLGSVDHARRVGLDRSLASLDEAVNPVGSGEDRPLGELVGDGGSEAEGVAAAIQGAEDAGRLREALRVLPEDLALVVRLRFGLAGEEEHKLSEIGERLGVCAEGARRREAKALALLRDALVARDAARTDPAPSSAPWAA